MGPGNTTAGNVARNTQKAVLARLRDGFVQSLILNPTILPSNTAKSVELFIS
jgi:hypothetical protein